MIINPILFYLIDVVDTLKIIFTILAIGCAFGCLISFIYVFEADDDEDREKGIRLGRNFMIWAIVTMILGVLLPNKETSYQMLVASQVTADNVNNAIEIIKNCVDYIMEAMNK